VVVLPPAAQPPAAAVFFSVKKRSLSKTVFFSAFAGSIVAQILPFLAIGVLVVVSVLVAGIFGSDAFTTTERLISAPELAPRNWAPAVRERLNGVLWDVARDTLDRRPGADSAKYPTLSKEIASVANKARAGSTGAAKKFIPDYAVFDWDNTSVFLDVEEATFAHMLETVAFKMTPPQLDAALRTGVNTAAEFKPEFRNAAGKTLNAGVLIADIVRDYAALRAAGSGSGEPRFQSDPRLRAVHRAFRAKFRFLYEALDGSFGAKVSYPWLTYIFVGMTPDEVRATAAAAVRWQLAQPIETVVWETPAECAGDAGVVRVSWKNGLRLVPEMQDLYFLLGRSGIETWVCTASLADVVRGVACDPAFGYSIPAERVVGMELQTGGGGRFLPLQPDGFVDTQGVGKTAAIKRLIAPKYGEREPLLVAGDSDGDASMLSSFPFTRVSLIIDRGKPADSPIGELAAIARKELGSSHADGFIARYLLQPRDESTGLFKKK
jgi:phosphoserine phosphatase